MTLYDAKKPPPFQTPSNGLPPHFLNGMRGDKSFERVFNSLSRKVNNSIFVTVMVIHY